VQVAIDRYQKIIETEIKNILKGKLSVLLKALGVDEIKDSDIQSYIEPKCNDGWCNVGIKFYIPDVGTYYISAELRDDGLFASTLLEVISKTRLNKIMEFVNKDKNLSDILKENDGEYEIYSQQKVDSGSLKEFLDKIVNAIDSWIKLWGKIGGIKILKET